MSGAVARLALALCLLIGMPALSRAAGSGSDPNDTAFGVVADTPESFALLLRLAHGLDHQDGLRILPIAGKGPVQTLTDLVQLKGIDAALVTSDTMKFLGASGMLTDAAPKISFVVRLEGLDIHAVARSGIGTFTDLDGKTVAAGPPSSASFIAAQLLIAASGFTVKLLVADGMDALRAVETGRADVAILVGRKPLAELKAIDATKGLHLIEVAGPAILQDAYSPSLLTHDDYPQLISKEHPVETVASSLIVAAFNWRKGSPQYERTLRLANAMFGALQPGSGGDADLNLAAAVPGWTRHGAAEDALQSRARKAEEATPAPTEN